MLLHKRSLTTIITTSVLGRAAGTQDKCYEDCRSNRRPVGPTRPWDAIDDLRNMLRLTRPYPHHFADKDELDTYDFAKFCDLGCNYFFVSSGAGANTPNDQHNQVSTLGQCLDQCEENFSYNITVEYSDLLEIGRLECRDGCHMALRRCQPGYYCLQVSFGVETDSSSSSIPDTQFSGGEMIPCPAGTYRETSYDAITECIPCPPNYFREDIKGKKPSDCSKCPPNTSSKSGSTSVKDCIRCPAGTFSVEAGHCECITPMACDKNQLPPPADAEKKDTVPYIGRW
jgi:hypothetical protein